MRRAQWFVTGCELRFEVAPDARADVWVTFDGRSRVRLARGDSLVVTASPHPLPTVLLPRGSSEDGTPRLRRGYSVGDESRRRRGYDVDIPWETGRGDAAAAT